MKATYGGIPSREGPTCLATTEPMAGYISAWGFVRGSASRFPVWKTVFGSWLLCRASTERMIVNRSSMAAWRGKCSQIRTPGSFVAIDPNGPRFCTGRSGLTSQVSIWLGPPAIQRRMTLFGPAAGRPASAPAHSRSSSPGKLSPAIPARLALSMFRRVARTSPSRSRARNPPKACEWSCGRIRLGSCLMVIGLAGSNR